jgi:argininosuccinate lyase
MKKLWNKNPVINENVEQFTIGKDAVFDMQLAKYDVLGSLAHAKMLHKVGVLTDKELEILDYELICIFNYIKFGKFRIDPAVEDVHSQIELMLTEKLGSVGKKIHTGRSRNDQVLLDIKLFLRYEIVCRPQQIMSCFKRKEQKGFDAGLYPLPAGHAFLFWFMVWCFCRSNN